MLPSAAAAKGPKDEGFDAAQRLRLTTQHLPWPIALPCEKVTTWSPQYFVALNQPRGRNWDFDGYCV